MTESDLFALVTLIFSAIFGLLVEAVGRARRRLAHPSRAWTGLEAVATVDRRSPDMQHVGAQRIKERGAIEAVLAHAEVRRGA